MFETNTASCGGFPGVSDSFGAALWGVDYALKLASVGFSGALFHVGGQGVMYNPFLRTRLYLQLSKVANENTSTSYQSKHISRMDHWPDLLLCFGRC